MRKVTEVAVGVLIDAHKRCLLGSRPEGKPYAGFWEFPGGKLELGETPHDALVREMKEELDVDIGTSYPWFVLEIDYPHAYVRLHFRRVWTWRGIFRGLERQSFTWIGKDAELDQYRLLPMVDRVFHRALLPDIIAVVADSPKEGLREKIIASGAEAIVTTKQYRSQVQDVARELGLLCQEVSPQVIVGASRYELSQDGGAEIPYVVCRDEGAAQRVLQAQMNAMPVYVPGEAQMLDIARQNGAHGVCIWL